MNCIKCYQEIPEGAKFCPHCGAQQSVAAETEKADTQPENKADTQPENKADTQPENNVPQTDGNYQGGYQGNYQSGYQNSYQNGSYQTQSTWQSGNQNQEPPVNWVPYLVLAIISMICCCPPGIVAVVFAAKINGAVNAGNMEEARSSAKTAKIWIIVAFVLGILSAILYTVLMSIFVGSSYYYYY